MEKVAIYSQNILVMGLDFMNKTLTTFLSEYNMTNQIINKIFNNMTEKHEIEMVFNLTQLEFDFPNELAIISYYIIDEDYPDVELSFNELSIILSKELTTPHKNRNAKREES